MTLKGMTLGLCIGLDVGNGWEDKRRWILVTGIEESYPNPLVCVVRKLAHFGRGFFTRK